jgi:hypothetical protein
VVADAGAREGIMGGTLQYELSVLIIKQGASWTAQCLEYDLAAQGGSIDEAQKAFEYVFTGQLLLDIKHGRLPLHGVGRAPVRFHEMFARATSEKPARAFDMPAEIPAPFVIRAIGRDVRVAYPFPAIAAR